MLAEAQLFLNKCYRLY